MHIRPNQTARHNHVKLTPAFSIIIPTLHEEKCILRMLGQFTPELRQKFKLEIIVSDGGSRDQTVELARPHADRLLEHSGQTRQTIAIGRNRGADAATGDLLFFLDADVQIPNLEKFLSRMEETLRRGVVIAATCDVRIDPAEEQTIDRLFHRFFNSFFWLMNQFGVGMGRGECQVVVRKEFHAVGGYNEAMAAGEDFDLFRRLGKLGAIHFDRSVTVYESARRYRKIGYLRVTFSWLMNALSIMLRKKSYSDEWMPVR